MKSATFLSRETNDVLLVLHQDDAGNISVSGGTMADYFRSRRIVPPITSPDPDVRFVQYVGGKIPTYWTMQVA